MKADEFLDSPSASSFLDGPETSSQGGAAFGIYPKQRATPSSPETKAAAQKAAEAAASGMEAIGLFPPTKEKEFDVGRIPESAAIGGAAGRYAPQILQTVGKGLQYVPFAPAKLAGKGLEVSGRALRRYTSPGQRTASGAAGFAAADIGGQTAEQLGAPAILGMGAGVASLEKGLPVLSQAFLGTPTKTSEYFAKIAEGLGFKLSPAQVRGDIPVPAKGSSSVFRSSAVENQKLANELTSAGTGKKVSEIDSDFISERIQELGKNFDKLYKGKQFNIDQDAINAISDISRIEAQLPNVAAVSPVKQVADNILRNYQSLTGAPGVKPSTFAIDGEALQRMRNALAQRARSSSSRSDAHEIYNLIDRVDASIAKNHPDIAAKLTELRPMYRNSIILEDLYRAGGIRQGNISLEQLGIMLRGKRDTLRRTGKDIDILGELGRELRLRARWETEGRAATSGEDILGRALGTGADLAGLILGTRSSLARDLQRYYANKTGSAKNFQAPVAEKATAPVQIPQTK